MTRIELLEVAKPIFFKNSKEVMTVPIKNYTTKISSHQTLGEIQELLATHGAKKIMIDYNDNGCAVAIIFALDCNGKTLGFRLEAKAEGVTAVLAKDRVKCDIKQAEKIAWRNIKDWVAAQIALVETEQAAMDELFLPMLIGDNNKTLYEAYCGGTLMLTDKGA